MIHRTNGTSILGAGAAITSRSTTRSRLKSRRRHCASTISSRKASAPQKAREATRGRDTQMGRPPATYAHGAPSTQQEQQDMLDQGLEMLQQMRTNFGME
jgi:hypothetical protein